MAIKNSMAKHIYEAVKWFISANTGRIADNEFSFTPMDPARNLNDLFARLTG